LFNNLDYSFSVGEEDGSGVGNPAPGGGSPALRGQLKVLRDFLARFDLARLEPETGLVLRAEGVVARVLAQPGKAYAVYLQGRSPAALRLNLPEGNWSAEWTHIETGQVLKRESVTAAAHAYTLLNSPNFSDALALRLTCP
jgi:hypothetical protein